jgi:DnaJ-like protein
MPICSRCGTKVGLFRTRSFNNATQRCSVCDTQVSQALKDFRSAFNRFASDGVLTDEEWHSLRSLALQRRLHLSEALSYVAIDAKALVDRAVDMTYDDGVVTLDEEKYIDYLLALLRLPPEFALMTRVELSDLRQLSEINRGRLPLTNSTIELCPGEVCHYEATATCASVARKPTQQAAGKIVVTSQRLVFAPQYRESFEVSWTNVHSTWAHENRIYIETRGPLRNVFFVVERPRALEALFRRLIEAARGTKELPPIDEPLDNKLPKAPHSILGISADATPEEITLAYKRMAKLYHPDKVSTLADEFQVLAETRMKEINRAYESIVKGAL